MKAGREKNVEIVNENRKKAQDETDPEIKANYEKTANNAQNDVQFLTDEIEIYEKVIEFIKKAENDAEAKLKECLEKKPK